MPPQGDANLPRDGEAKSTESKVSTFVENAWDSLRYNAVQVPADGIAQLSDRVLGTNYLPNVQMFEAPKQAEFGSTAWYGQTIGGTVGGALPFIAMYRMMGPGGAANLETGAYGLGRAALPYIGKAAATGAIYSGVFQPVQDTDHFWSGRMKNATVGGLTGATLTASSIGLKASGVRFLSNDIVAGAASGVPSGVVAANAHSLMEGKGLATAQDTLQTAATFSLGGAFMGGANALHEHLKPTSGIRGVRTVEDMRKLADSTRAPDWETRRAQALFDQAQAAIRQKAMGDSKTTADGSRTFLTQFDLTTASDNHYTAVYKALSRSKLPDDLKEMIARGNHDLIVGMEAIQGQEPIVVIYGSARLGEDTFAYQRTRYLAGRLAQKGITVMTGGGEKGIMEAANRGAFEAGGKSIGVNVELPFEQKPNPWLTTSVTHRDFFTRKEVLRAVKAVVIEEGGFGTSDEGFNGLTLMQTGKTEKIPTFFEGVNFYKPLVKGFIEGSMLKTKVISPEDIHLYTLTGDPNSIVNRLAHLKGQSAGVVVSYDQPKAGVRTQVR